MQLFDDELVSGSEYRSVWKLTWPFVGAQAARGLNLLVTHSLLGIYVGQAANAALGVGWQLFMLAIVLFIALLQGMAILIARYTGRQDSVALSRLVFETFKATVLFLFCFLLPIGYFGAPTALDLMNAEPEVQEHALPFLRLVLIGGAPLLLVFLLNRAFQASGDVRMPLVLGIISMIVNITINVLLIVVFDMGLMGAAWGFIIGPMPSLFLAILMIYRGKMVIRPPRKHTLLLDFGVLKNVVRIGLPTGVTALLATLVGVVILSMLGSLENGTAAQAVYSIGYLQLFTVFLWVALSLSAASNTLHGQNIGAGKPERGKRCVYAAALGGSAYSILIGILFWIFPVQLLSMFGITEGPALEMGIDLLRFLAFAGIVTVGALTFFGGLMGAGDTKSPMFITMFTQTGLLLGYCFLVDHYDTLTSRSIWTAILIAATARCALAMVVFIRGRWTDIRVEIEPQEPASF